MRIGNTARAVLLLIIAGVLLRGNPAIAQTISPVRRVVVISIDGFLPEYYLRAQDFGLKLPNMQRLKGEGSWADGVVSQYPSLTLPSHTSIVTGARPAKHGISQNTIFDPLVNSSVYHSDAATIKARTLWDEAGARGLKTAAVGWPVTTGAPIDYLIATGGGPGDRDPFEYYSGVSTPNLIEAIIKQTGKAVLEGHLDYALRDRFTAMAASYILQKHRPHLSFLYFASTDHEQHEFGKHSPEAKRAFEAVDAHIGEIVDAARKAGLLGETAFVITGDHGFAPAHATLQPNVILRDNKLLHADVDGKILDWQAVFHGGALRLKDPNDAALRRQLEKLFRDLASGQYRDVFRVVDRNELDSLGAYPEAVFLLEPMLGYFFSSSVKTSEFVMPTKLRGMHGYLPTLTEMHTGLILSGAGIQRGVEIPLARQIDIGPTIARLLGLRLPDADGIPLVGVLADLPR